MTELEHKEASELIKQERLKRGLSQDDLVDDQLGKSTISYIENGMHHVSPEKVEYYCQKLGFSFDDLPRMKEERKRRLESIALRLLSIESTLDLADPDQAYKEITELKNELSKKQQDSGLMVKIKYLTGRINIKKNNLKRATTMFNQVIGRINKEKEDSPIYKTNLKAASYHELGRISYYQNDMAQALDYVERGINAFREHGEKESLIYVLNISKVIYLDHLGKTNEAYQELNKLWKQKNKIENAEILINLYDLKANLLKQLGMYEEAIKEAEHGIILARGGKTHNRACELWTTLGSIYIQLNQVDDAETCLLTALNLKEQINKMNKGFILFPIYKELALLYIKRQEWDKAEKILQDAQREGTHNPIAHNQILLTLGDCYRLQKKYDEALPAYQQGLLHAQENDLLPQQHDLLIRMGFCWRELEQDKNFLDSLVQLFKIEVQLLNENEVKQ